MHWRPASDLGRVLLEGRSKMRETKQYAVEVTERFSHGRHGKTFYFGLYLCGFNKKDAEEVGYETLAEMTFDEINETCVSDGMKPWQIYDQIAYGSDRPIGFELAEKYFQCKAYIER